VRGTNCMANSGSIGALVIGLLALLMPGHAAAAPTCEAAPGWASREIHGEVRHPDLFVHEAGLQSFVLMPFEFGWRIGMLDRDGLEIPVYAAPSRPEETNPLTIAGWHFRNLDNSGPNTGDVNAPQHQRRFAFGTLATRAMTDPATEAETVAAEGLGGLGVLDITGFTLAAPVPEQRAAFSTLSFTACLVWQGGGDRLAPLADTDPVAAFETAAATMLGCGLQDATFRLSDHMGQTGMQPAFLAPDMDGDGTPDLVVPVLRRGDGAPGLAICLLGTETLVLAGYDGRIGRHLDPAYFGRADKWGVHAGPVWPSAEEDAPPHLTADAVILGKEDSSSVILYLKPDLTPASYWQGD
jgi:hypothetical protein